MKDLIPGIMIGFGSGIIFSIILVLCSPQPRVIDYEKGLVEYKESVYRLVEVDSSKETEVER